MIADLKPYPAMKDSGVPWLGDVPAHWEVRRLRNAAEMRVSNVDKHSKEEEEPVRLCNYVDVYKNDRIRDGMPFMCATATGDEIARFRLAVGDVLITKDSEVWNDIGVPALVVQPADNLVCGYHLALLRPFTERIIGGYLFRVMQSNGVAYQFHVEANGVTRYGLSHSAIKSIWLPTPPRPEQAAIVRFLDHADRRIRRYIRAKQKMIKLLEEQKQAIIHRAVTRGLDPNVRLKPSGVEWLGEVPKHWEVVRLKAGDHAQLSRVGRLSVMRNSATHNEWGVLTVGCVNRDAFDESQDKKLPTTLKPLPRLEIRDGDILVSRANTRELLELAAVAIQPRSKIDPERQVIPISPKGAEGRCAIPGACNSAANKSGSDREQYERSQRFHAKHRAVSDSESAAFASNDRRAKADSESTQTADRFARNGGFWREREIDLLREYRTRLVADVVTGKLDVREAAARLPDEVEELEPLDETDADAEVTDDLEAAPEEAAA